MELTGIRQRCCLKHIVQISAGKPQLIHTAAVRDLEIPGIISHADTAFLIDKAAGKADLYTAVLSHAQCFLMHRILRVKGAQEDGNFFFSELAYLLPPPHARRKNRANKPRCLHHTDMAGDDCRRYMQLLG